MSEPSYHLESVVRNRDEREDFTGPLDLILLLLSRNRIEIRDIQISSLLEQYLAWMERMKEMDLEVASEFVQMASHLTYIKTRMLLTSDKEEVTELSSLVEALERLQNRDVLAALKTVTAELERRSRTGLRLHTREPSPAVGVKKEYHETPERLLHAVTSLLLRGGGEEKEENEALQRAMPRPVSFSITEKSEELLRLLREKGSVTLSGIYSRCRSRSELVAAFLSVLELCSDGVLALIPGESGYAVTMTEESNGTV